MLVYLIRCGSRIGGVTLGERGLLWYDETGAVRSLNALPVPPHQIIDTQRLRETLFHGAYPYSHLANPVAA